MMKFFTALLVAAFAYVGFESFRFLSAGPGRADETMVFQVPNGISFRQIAQQLESKGLVISSLKMRVLAKLSGQGGRVKSGEYSLNRGMSPQEILSVLVSGKSILYPVTFPEGSNIYEMAAILENKGLYKGADFLKLVRDRAVAQELLGVDVSSLEGYLYPETYNVTRFTPLRELLTNMVQNFKTAYSSVEGEMKAKGTVVPTLSRHELVTLASVVEKETGAPVERPMIASVFYNRLRKRIGIFHEVTERSDDPLLVLGRDWCLQTKHHQGGYTSPQQLQHLCCASIAIWTYFQSGS